MKMRKMGGSYGKGGRSTGKNPGQHKGGSGDHKEYTKPGYPTSEEGVSSTVPSPNYPRKNFSKGGQKGT